MTKVAICRRDGAVLVGTILWAGAEFYCLDCGGSYGWLDPVPADETPELLAKVDEVEAEWKALSAGALNARSWLRDCPACHAGGEYHVDHATTEELVASGQAFDRITLRKRVPA